MAERQRSYTEEESLAALAATEVGPRTARCMSWIFVALLITVPLLQAGIEIGRHQVPQVVSLFQPLRAAATRLAGGHPTESVQALRPFLSAEYLHAFEDQLQTASLPRQMIQPRLQTLLVTAGFGTNECVIGRNHWLFYQPGIQYLSGPNLLDPTYLHARARKLAGQPGTAAPCPDPRPAIYQLQEDCRQAGAHLVLVPVPDKAMFQAAELTRRLRQPPPPPALNNRGYQRLLDELVAHGIDVFDPSQVPHGEATDRYLAQDTHWTPQYMEEVAFHLAAHIRTKVALLPDKSTIAFYAIEKQIRRVGDLVAMLRLPADQAVFAPQAVTIHPVVDTERAHLWRPSTHAPVLLLGDSFTNIFSDGEGAEGLGWGRAAGLAPQLSRHLYVPIDVIARNGAGASQTRLELARRPRPLKGKQVVVWQFAARELALGDWKPISLQGAPAGSEQPSQESSPLVVQATIEAASRTPVPYSVPYRECLTFMRVHIDRVEQGACTSDCVIAAFWSLKDNVLQPAAQYAPGDRLRLTLTPLLQAASRLQAVRYADDLNDYTHPTYIVDEEERP